MGLKFNPFTGALDQVAVVNQGDFNDLFIDADGNVGIGTASPSEKLDVSGTADVKVAIQTTSTGAGANAALRLKTGDYNWSLQTGDAVSGGIRFYDSTNSAERLRIDSTGKLIHIGGGGSYTTPAVQFNGSAPANSLVVDSNGRLGLGTSSPSYLLDANGEARIVTRLRIDGASSGDKLKLTGITTGSIYSQISNTGNTTILGNEQSTGGALCSGGLAYATVLNAQSARPLQLATSNTARLTITSAGNVGIGTTSPNYKLEVAPDANRSFAVDTDGSFSLILRNTSTNAGADLTFDTKDSLAFKSDGDTKVTILNSGNVGIGTTSPGAPLDVRARDLHLGATSGGAGLITFRRDSGTQSGYFGWDAGSDLVMRWGNDSGSGRLAFNTNSAERVRIDEAGRLLVGTTSSIRGGILEVAKATPDTQIQITESSDSGNGPQLRLTRTRGSNLGSPSPVQANNNLGRIRWDSWDSATYRVGADIVAQADGQTWASGDCPTRLVFRTNAGSPDTDPTERMRITSGGLVDIGGVYSVGANAIRFDVQGSNFSRNTTSSATQIAFANPNGAVGSIATSGSTTSYNETSDYRLKENVTAVTDGIARLKQLKPSRFNFIADPTETVDGFIAHEVQSVVPEAVTGEKDAVDDEGKPEYQGIDKSKLVPLLTAALQEAVAKIETLEAKVAALEAN